MSDETQRLFEFFANEHGLTLLESEMTDIIFEVNAVAFNKCNSYRNRISKLEDAANVALGHLTGGMDGDWRDCDPAALLRDALDS